MSNDNDDILNFAEQFLATLSKLPVQYERTFNAPVKRGKQQQTASKKPTVNIVEVTLKRLHGKPTSSQVKISRTEPTLVKVEREAANLLGCQLRQVVLVVDGQILKTDDVTKATQNTNTPIYIFDRSEWSKEPSLPLGSEFRADFISLLRNHGQNQPEILADRFITEHSNWLIRD